MKVFDLDAFLVIYNHGNCDLTQHKVIAQDKNIVQSTNMFLDVLIEWIIFVLFIFWNI